MQALETFITVPQSSLRSYTATDSAATSDVTKAIPYSSLEYKVHPHLTCYLESEAYLTSPLDPPLSPLPWPPKSYLPQVV